MNLLDLLRGRIPAKLEPEHDETVLRDRVLLPGPDGELVDVTGDEEEEENREGAGA